MWYRLHRKGLLALFVLLPACGLFARGCMPGPITDAEYQRLYADPPPPREAPLRVYHLGHSLVGRDMPFMLQQLAGEGHVYHSQLGWGANLVEHWEPDVPVKGFDQENTHAQFRDPHEALATGEIEAMVVTEALPIQSAIEYHKPAYYLMKWASAAWDGNPGARVYFYETWHSLDTEDGWLTRLDRDLGLYWEGGILRRTLGYGAVERPIYVIPGGQVMAAFTRAVEMQGGVGPIRDRTDLFNDHIHFNDYGAYLIALTHYAVLYGRSPIGLPHRLRRADGSPALDMGAEAARLMQEVVWQVVTSYPQTGVARP